jgi:sulfatase modifying factor 1
MLSLASKGVEPTMIRIASCLFAASLGLIVACGSTEETTVATPNQAGRDAGRDGSGAGASTHGFELDGGGGSGFSVDIEDSARGVLTSATLNCPGDCIDLQGVARGGVQPYTYTWSDGAPGPTRHLCPNSATTISVSVKDAGVTGGEFARPPQTTNVTLTIHVLSCSEAGPSDGSWSDGTPENLYGCGYESAHGSNSGTAPPSCAPGGPGMTDCGAQSESCCTSLEVTGGTYYRTYPNPGNTTGPTEADPASVSCFRLDKYLVTVGRFRQFVAAWNNGYTPAAGSGKHTHLNGGNGLNAMGGGYEPGWDATWNNTTDIDPTNANLSCDANYGTWTIAAGNNEKLPINCASWWESYAFCIWDGGFLPSDAEWKYASAGGSQQRAYPWGTTAPGTGNQYAIYGCYYPRRSGIGSCTNASNIAPVGTAAQGAGLWGQVDLAGELWEWNLDSISLYGQCTDCAGFTMGSNMNIPPYRVAQGGDFRSGPPFRSSGPSSGSRDRQNNVGFRCARTP